jgi:DNA-binding transcriptional LysR family regulator
MSDAPRITLDQWRALIAVVDAGGYAQAAEALHKSQSSVTYAVQKLQSQLGVKAFEIRGRKAVLTDTGRLLHQRARLIIDEALGLERSAKRLSAGWEPEISLAVEVLFPTGLLLSALDRFGKESPHTHIEVYESVMGGTREVLEQDRVDFAITPHVPPGFEASQLMRMRLVPAAHPGHALHKLKRSLTLRDLRQHRQLAIRDTGAKRDKRMSFVEAKQRWTVGHMATSMLAATQGYGFAWFPEEKIRDEVAAGLLKPLPMAEGGERFVDVYIVFRDRESAGPGTMRLAAIIRECVDEQCKARARR